MPVSLLAIYNILTRRIRFLSEPLVTLVVGRTRVEFLVHRQVLCARSDFFKAALGGQFLEAQNGRLELPDEEEDTVGTLLHWLYSGAVNTEPSGLKPPTTHYEARRCVTLLMFSRKIVLEQLTNVCTDAMRRYYYNKLRLQERFSLSDISLLWEEEVGLKLRACLSITIALYMTNARAESTFTGFSEAMTQLVEQGGEFAVTFLKSLLFCQNQITLRPLSLLQPYYDCLFHEHRWTSPCGDAIDPKFARRVTGIQNALKFVGATSDVDTQPAAF
ncbi:MAG: hypothetical protein Q9212_003261 [Teloschistes hypoglaucus]